MERLRCSSHLPELVVFEAPQFFGSPKSLHHIWMGIGPWETLFEQFCSNNAIPSAFAGNPSSVVNCRCFGSLNAPTPPHDSFDAWETATNKGV